MNHITQGLWAALFNEHYKISTSMRILTFSVLCDKAEFVKILTAMTAYDNIIDLVFARIIL
jgi:hypothetical protein